MLAQRDPPQERIVCDSPELLRRIERSLSKYTLINAPNGDFGASGGIPSAQVRITVSNGQEFSIWIDRDFLLDNSVSTSDNGFFNWSFAHLLQHIRLKEGGRGFSEKELSLMSGAAFIEEQMAAVRALENP
jgi:hypothetical protein